MSALVVLAAGALVWAPGSLLARLAGVRRGWSLVVGPALTWGAVALGAVVVPRAGLRWGLLSALGWWAVLAAPVAVLSAVLGRRPGPPTRPGPPQAEAGGDQVALAVGGVVAAAAVPLASAWRAGVRPSSVCQLWDAVWHANLTAWIAATGTSGPVAAPSALSGAGWRTVHTYYPDALHALAALVVHLTGASAVLALGSVVLVTYGALVPVAVAALVWATTGGSGLGAGAGALAAVLPVAFPTDHWWRGVWSYGAALADAPLVAAVVVAGLRGRLCGPRARWRAALPGALACAGVLGLQPAGAVVVALLVASWLLGGLLALPARRGLVGAVVAAAALAAVGPGVALLREHSAVLAGLARYDYRTSTPATSALREVLGLVVPVDAGLGYRVPVQGGQWGLAALVGAGALACLSGRRTAWAALAWVVAVGVAVATIAPVLSPLRSLSVFFYSSPYRTTALAGLVGAVVVGSGAARLADLGRQWSSGWQRSPGRQRGVVPGSAVRLARGAGWGVVVLAVAGLAAGTVTRAEVRLRAGYADRVVGPSQEAVMAALARQPLPAGARVLDDPVDGGPWMLAVAGVTPMFVQYRAGVQPASVRDLERSLHDVDTEPRVQAELRRWRVCYVYANATLVTARRRTAPGFTGLDAVRSLQPVARSGGAVAYRVLVPGTPCAPR